MASDLLTVAEVKEHVTTGLSDTALERVVDGEDAYIRRMVGEHDPASTMSYVEDRPDYRMSLPRAASAVTSVTINYWRQSDRVMDEDDYWMEDGGLAVRIAPTFLWDLNFEYGDRVTIEYTPVSENDERIKALIELVRLATQDTGLDSERDDTFQYMAKDKLKARRQIIAPLRHNHGGFGVLA